MRRDGIFAHLLQVLALERALKGDPVLPRALQRQAVHVLELIRIVAPAAFVQRTMSKVPFRVSLTRPGLPVFGVRGTL